MKHSLILVAIVLLGFGLRFYLLGSLPVILNRDEAALAYNALLLKETGQDEWQRSWPLALESFGDYKLIGYPAVLSVFFQFFEVNDTTVRLPSALAGTGLVVLSYFFAKELKLGKRSQLLLPLLIAVSPIFFFYSRIAFEANVGLTLIAAVLWLLLKGSQQSRFNFRLALIDSLAVAIALWSVLTYNTPLLLLPLIAVSIPLLRGLKDWQRWFIPVIGLLIVFAAIFSQLLPLTIQKSSITIFSDENVWLQSVERRQQFSGVGQVVLGSKYILYAQIVLANYVKSISPQFLVTQGGDHPWHSLPGFGHLSWTVYILGLIGIGVGLIEVTKSSLFSLGSTKNIKKFSKNVVDKVFLTPNQWLVYLLLISLLPSVVTVDAPHATRSLLFFFIVTVFAVTGFEWSEKSLINFYKNIKIDIPGFYFFKKYFFQIVVMLVLISATNYFGSYFRDYPTRQPRSLLAGYDIAITKIDQKFPDRPLVVVDPEGFGYILTAWYLRMSPQKFHSTVIKQLPDRIGFRYGEQVAQFHFIVNLEDRSTKERAALFREGEDWKILEF